MARENYQLIKFFKLDYYLFVKKYPLSSQQWVTIHGVENLHHALGQARTVHFFTAHYGALYQLPLIIQPFGVIPVIALEHPGKGPLPHWEDSIEKRFFETHIDDVYRKRAIHLYRRGTGFLPVYTRLKKGGVLGTVVDVPAETGSSESATTIPFLGGRVSFCNEFARFALKTRALLIPVFLRIKHPAHYEMSIYQPLDTETWASKQGPVEACMRHCFALIESKIREDPAQWWLWKDLDHFWHGHA
jgi:lauroyl/myristoyl acyltransferase